MPPCSAYVSRHSPQTRWRGGRNKISSQYSWYNLALAMQCEQSQWQLIDSLEYQRRPMIRLNKPWIWDVLLLRRQHFSGWMTKITKPQVTSLQGGSNHLCRRGTIGLGKKCSLKGWKSPWNRFLGPKRASIRGFTMWRNINMEMIAMHLFYRGVCKQA